MAQKKRIDCIAHEKAGVPPEYQNKYTDESYNSLNQLSQFHLIKALLYSYLAYLKTVLLYVITFVLIAYMHTTR